MEEKKKETETNQKLRELLEKVKRLKASNSIPSEETLYELLSQLEDLFTTNSLREGEESFENTETIRSQIKAELLPLLTNLPKEDENFIDTENEVLFYHQDSFSAF